MRKGLTGLLLGVGVALIVGLVVVGVVAAQTPTPATPGGFHGAVLAKAAAILGVSEAKLSDALIQAHSQALDDAVEAGYLTQAQADWMKQHHQSMPRNGGPGLMGGYGKMGHGMMGGGMMGGRFGGGYGPGYGPPAAQPSR
jgi:hypothetical protein